MPTNTEIVKCPVCDTAKQVGLVTSHIVKAHIHNMKFDDVLLEKITNRGDIGKLHYHPDIEIDGRVFTLCPMWEKDARGFRHESKNKNSLQGKHEGCTLCYSEWMEPDVKSDEQPELPTATDDKIVLIPQRNDSNELIKLREENAKMKRLLEQFKTWMKLVPHVENLPDSPKAVIVNAEAPKVKANVLAKPQQVRKTVKASKKEQEKGMWTTKCESCKTLAQFATDLKPCSSCKKLCHFNCDLNSCYHWDCEICNKKICYSCVKSHGGNKMHPLCSVECHKKYREQRGEE